MHIVCSVLYLITNKSLSFAFNLIQVNCTNDFGVDKQVDDKCITVCVLRQVHLYRGDIYPKHANPRQQEKNIKRSTLFLTESKQIKNQQFEVTLPRNEI